MGSNSLSLFGIAQIYVNWTELTFNTIKQNETYHLASC